ncbi:MAG: enolase C-terminal domain-like protein [Pseudomonadota bacterium]
MNVLARPDAPARKTQTPLIIRRIDAIPVALPLKTPMSMAGITIATADNVIVRMEAADGTVGWGEAASAPTMTGDTLGGLVAAVRDHLAPMLVGKDARDWPALRNALHRSLVGNGGAHSAVEMALLDMTGRATGTKLIDLVGKVRRSAVKPMWLLGNKTADQDVAEAKIKEKEGFHFFKLKIGTKPPEKEIEIAHAVRAAMPKMPLCADANCGLTLEAARKYIDGTRKANLMFVEQPLAYDDIPALKKLTKASKVPIGIDEGIHSMADIETNAKAGAGGVSLKLIKLGGITGALEAAKLCQKLGLSVNIAAKIAESSIASAATVHLACGVPKADWGVSITHFYLAEDLVKKSLPLKDGFVSLPDQPGLGIEVDEAAVSRFTVR